MNTLELETMLMQKMLRIARSLPDEIDLGQLCQIAATLMLVEAMEMAGLTLGNGAGKLARGISYLQKE